MRYAIALLFALTLYLALVMGPQDDHLKLKQFHHGYLGILLVVGSLAVSWLYWTGLLLLADDAWQHAIQRWARLPGYRSPLFRLYARTVARFPFVAGVNRWLDRVLA